MKTMLAVAMMITSGCAAMRGMSPTECEAKAAEIVDRTKKVTARMCESQLNYKAKATILDAAIDTVGD